MDKIKVAQYKNGRYIRKYNSLTEAARAVNGQEWHISECVNNIPHRNTHKGYEWRKYNG